MTFFIKSFLALVITMTVACTPEQVKQPVEQIAQEVSTSEKIVNPVHDSLYGAESFWIEKLEGIYKNSNGCILEISKVIPLKSFNFSINCTGDTPCSEVQKKGLVQYSEEHENVALDSEENIFMIEPHRLLFEPGQTLVDQACLNVFTSSFKKQ